MSETEKTFSPKDPPQDASPAPQKLSVGECALAPDPQTPVDCSQNTQKLAARGPKTASRPSKRSKVALKRLPPHKQAFVRAFASPDSPAFGVATQAVLATNPRVHGAKSASVVGTRLLADVSIQQAVVEAGWSKAELESQLKMNARKCWEKEKLSDHREAIMALGKLSGHLVDRQEVTNRSNEQREAIRRAVAENLNTPN